MRKSTGVQWACRVLIYIVGLFFMATGATLSIRSNLGVSPITSVPYVFSLIAGMPLNSWIVIIYSAYILVQVLILRRDFKPVNLLQIVFVTIFGYFTDLAKWIVGDFSIPTYPGQLLTLAMGIVLVAVGVTLYIEVDVLPMPMEGMTLAIATKTRKPFPTVKIVVDCLAVALSSLLSLVCFHALIGVREGTVIAAVVTGKLVALLKKPLSPLVRRLCFSGTDQAQAVAADGRVEHQQSCP